MSNYSTNVYTGVLQVNTTPQILANGRPLTWGVTVRSLPSNAVPAYIISPGLSITEGYPLYPGDSIELRVNNLSDVYLLASSVVEVRYVAV